MTEHPEIPKGIYCYGSKGLCPHWGRDASKHRQESGLCVLTGHKDWEDTGDGLLWDQVKSCGINDELEEDEIMSISKREVWVAICQIKVVARRPDINTANVIKHMLEARRCGADIVVFGEMTVPGYMVGDDWEDMSFIRDCISYTEDIDRAAEDLGIQVVIGSVTLGAGNHEDGRPAKHNSAIILGAGRGEYHKTNLPNYREFDDKRYFVSGAGERYTQSGIVPNGMNFTMSICEDGWDDDYDTKPLQDAAAFFSDDPLGFPHVHFNLSCSPFTTGKNSARNRRFAKHSERFSALFYVNNVGIQNNGKNVFVFDGSSTVYVNGAAIAALPPLVECSGMVKVTDTGIVVGAGPWMADQTDPETHEVLTYAIKEFSAQSKIRRAVIGLSGGVDSALSVMLHVKALGPENVLAVNMPTQYNSETTKGIAREIADNLGIKYMVIPIESSRDAITQEIDKALCLAGDGWANEYAEDGENIQARMRGAGVQAALAGGLRAVFPNNGNKAEVTVGYCTLGGDHMGYLAPLGDLWKHEVYQTAKELEATFGKRILPDELFTVKPSAELSAAQNVDEGKGDPIVYWYHDKLFASWVEPWSRDSLEDTLRHYANNTLLERLGILDKYTEFVHLFPDAKTFISDLERWWGLFKGMGAVKRVQSPPVVVISRRAFGFDFRETLGGAYYTRGYMEIKNRLLNQDVVA